MKQAEFGYIAATFALLTALSASGCSKAGGHSDTTGGFEPPGSILDVDFALRRDLHLGSAFEGDVHAVDLNGDGLVDLCEANFGTKKVTMALGNPDGTFTTLYEFDCPGHTWKVTAADLDGDGMLDVAVACGDYLGSGTSAVAAFMQGPTPGEFHADNMVCIDLPADPKDVVPAPKTMVPGAAGPAVLFVPLRDTREVVVIEYDSGDRVAVSCGGLVQTASYNSSSLGATGKPTTAAILDIGDDGFLDLVVGEVEVEGGGTDRLIAYANDGTGLLPPTVVLDPVYGPVIESVGDANNDGFDDLAVAQADADHVFFLAGDGSGLSTAQYVFFEGPTSSVIFPDVNGDGLTDVVGTVLNDSYVSVHLADGNMTWGEPMRYSVGYLPRAIGLMLLPGDEIPDLLCANAQDLSVLVGLGGGMFRGALGYPTMAEGPRAIRTADLDNDGDLDAVVVSAGDDLVSFMEGKDDGSLETVTTVPLAPVDDETPVYLSIVDVDGDGLCDVLITVHELDQVRLLRNPGTIADFSAPEPGDVFSVGAGPLGLDTADVNNDGLLDVVVGLGGASAIQVLLNMGAGEFVPQTPIATAYRPAAIRCMDLDNDGLIDIAMTTGDVTAVDEEDSRYLVLLAGNGTGGFAAAAALPIASLATSLDFGDLDGNDLIDIVVAPTGNEYEKLFIAMNGGGFQFSLGTLNVGIDPANVLVADIDESGALDLLVVTGYGEVKIAYGDGAGGFPDVLPSVRGELPVLFDTLSVDYADMNGDDLRDLVMVSHRSAMVWVGLNTSVRMALD